MRELAREPPAWFLNGRESRTYYRAGHDWEFFVDPGGSGEAQVKVPLNRGDEPVHPEAARWLAELMEPIDGKRLTWHGEFCFPLPQLSTVERALAGMCDLAARAVELETTTDVGSFLRSRPARIVREEHSWRLVLGGKPVRAQVKLVRVDGYRVECSLDGVLWDGTKKADWPRELVEASSWEDFRRAVLNSRPGSEPSARARIDAFLTSLGTGENIALKKFAGSWSTAIARWR